LSPEFVILTDWRLSPGSTYTGHFENVKEFSDALDDYEAKTGIHVPIHVDAAR
jgi:glutamate/tyrosine decarboxylase-like PLP-dependent enzyme